MRDIAIVLYIHTHTHTHTWVAFYSLLIFTSLGLTFLCCTTYITHLLSSTIPHRPHTSTLPPPSTPLPYSTPSPLSHSISIQKKAYAAIDSILKSEAAFLTSLQIAIKVSFIKNYPQPHTLMHVVHISSTTPLPTFHSMFYPPPHLLLRPTRSPFLLSPRIPPPSSWTPRRWERYLDQWRRSWCATSCSMLPSLHAPCAGRWSREWETYFHLRYGRVGRKGRRGIMGEWPSPLCDTFFKYDRLKEKLKIA